jgi:predicted enzyme related to lactoylglutathione lyase
MMTARPVWIAFFLASLPPTASPALAQLSFGAKPQQMMYVAINANNFEKMRTFYMSVIGLKELPGSRPTAKPQQSTSLSFTGAYDDSFLMISHNDGAAPTGAGALQRLVFKEADIGAVVERARAAGAVILNEPGPAHGLSTIFTANIRDPEGNEIELVEVRK